jgi:mannose-6-phosphate isomerase class I
MRTSHYDKFPQVAVPGGSECVWQGWGAIALQLRDRLSRVRASGSCEDGNAILAIECYSGVFELEICTGLRSAFDSALWIDTREAFLPAAEVDRLVAPDLGGNDPVFGFLTRLTLEDFLCPENVASLRSRIAGAPGTAIVIGPGASLIAPQATLLVYANLARWEAQRRQRRGDISNLGVENRGLKPSLQYKRAYFIDWRVCDRLKQRTLSRWDFLLDTCVPGDPKLVTGQAFRVALKHCVTRPFRVVPLFDPGPWGGQWMKEVCDLDREQINFAWCFDCVLEENSLLLRFGDVRVEVPAIDLVFAEPRALLGEPVYGRFGPDFPIRFDFLDTMGGGNLSLQVHPLTEYIQERFGLRYTQDESYYLLDAKPGAVVYLTRKRDAKFDEMITALEAAQNGGPPFDDRRFIARFPARKHDHFLIPAGTLHGSGADSMVLEISATPYTFTFKLWDWNRMGLDGKPRPINIAHGKANIVWERDEDYAVQRLINQITHVARGEGWREERTGLHEAEFIETRRHWFTGSAPHHTGGERHGSVNVLNLVEGNQAVVESPEGAFEPFVVHYAETFIVPAAVGAYRVRPVNPARATEFATIKAFVRCDATVDRNWLNAEAAEAMRRLT